MGGGNKLRPYSWASQSRVLVHAPFYILLEIRWVGNKGSQGV